MGNQTSSKRSPKHLAILNIKKKKLTSNRKRSWLVGWFKKSKELTIDELDSYRSELKECCLTSMISDKDRLYSNLQHVLQILKLMMKASNINDFDSSLVTHMICASLTCSYHLIRRLIGSRSENLMQEREARDSLLIFDKILYHLSDKHYTPILQEMFKVFTDNELWTNHYFCSETLKHALQFSEDISLFVGEILSFLESSFTTNPTITEQIFQIILIIKASTSGYFLNAVFAERFLNMYCMSLLPEDDEFDNYYRTSVNSLELCVRSMVIYCDKSILKEMILVLLEVLLFVNIYDQHLKSLVNILDDTTLCFIKDFDDIIPDEVFELIIKVIDSDNLSESLLGNRMCQYFFDRSGNRLKFDTPKIFHPDGHYDITIPNLKKDNQKFYRRYRVTVQEVVLKSIKRHGQHKIYLETIYKTIALFQVEIPCSYTASAGIYLSLTIQDLALNDTNLLRSHHLHAVVISIISLISYIHKSIGLYGYFLKILEYRSNYATHLNPKLYLKYEYKRNSILWNKPDLFFEDWCIRYELLDQFKNTRKGKLEDISIRSRMDSDVDNVDEGQME